MHAVGGAKGRSSEEGRRRQAVLLQGGAPRVGGQHSCAGGSMFGETKEQGHSILAHERDRGSMDQGVKEAPEGKRPPGQTPYWAALAVAVPRKWAAMGWP